MVGIRWYEQAIPLTRIPEMQCESFILHIGKSVSCSSTPGKIAGRYIVVNLTRINTVGQAYAANSDCHKAYP